MAKKEYTKTKSTGRKAVTKTKAADGSKSRTATRTRKDGSTVTRSRRVTKSPTGKTATRSVTNRSPKTELTGYSETTKSTTRKKVKSKASRGFRGKDTMKSTVKKTSTVRPESTGGKYMGQMAARDQVRGKSTTRSKVVTRKKGVGRSVNRTASSSDSYNQGSMNPQYRKREKAIKSGNFGAALHSKFVAGTVYGSKKK